MSWMDINPARRLPGARKAPPWREKGHQALTERSGRAMRQGGHTAAGRGSPQWPPAPPTNGATADSMTARAAAVS